MKQCDFKFPAIKGDKEFVCVLRNGHLSDHQDSEGFMMFNVATSILRSV
jgi:hypothetical protein